MVFEAKAASEEDFEKWIRKVQASQKVLNQDTYKEIYKPSQYDPVQYFSLQDKGLFQQIIMKYNIPKV